MHKIMARTEIKQGGQIIYLFGSQTLYHHDPPNTTNWFATWCSLTCTKALLGAIRGFFCIAQSSWSTLLASAGIKMPCKCKLEVTGANNNPWFEKYCLTLFTSSQLSIRTCHFSLLYLPTTFMLSSFLSLHAVFFPPLSCFPHPIVPCILVIVLLPFSCSDSFFKKNHCPLL